jgi:hypothetical protein
MIAMSVSIIYLFFAHFITTTTTTTTIIPSGPVILLFWCGLSGPLSCHQIIYGISLTLIYYHNHHMQRQHMDVVTHVVGENKLNDH